ncbi:MAG: hypothetical protein ACPL07_00080, partial [Candidatus Bathyarchaeia archaeon]
IDPKTYLLFRTWNLSSYKRPIIPISGLYYGKAINYMYYLMMLHGDVYFYYGTLHHLFNFTEDNSLLDKNERALSKLTVFLLEQNKMNKTEIMNHYVIISNLLYRSTDIPEEYILNLNVDSKYLWVQPLPKGGGLNYSLHHFSGTNCEIEIHGGVNCSAVGLVFILNGSIQLQAFDAIRLRANLDKNALPLLVYIRVNIERWVRFLQIPIKFESENNFIRVYTDDFSVIGKVNKNDNIESLEIYIESPKPGNYTFDLNLERVPPLLPLQPSPSDPIGRRLGF